MKNEKKYFFDLTVKAVIINNFGEVLVLKRSKDSETGSQKYDLPGGRLGNGENIKDCLIREIQEELGIEVEIGELIYAFDFPKKYEKKINFGEEKITLNGKGLRFIAYYKSGEIKLSNEHESFEWLKVEEAIEKFGNNDFETDKKKTIEKVKEYLKMKESLDGWKRERADFENYKKRQTENSKDIIFYANLNLILEILPILDNFYSATKHIPEKQKNEAWITGIMYIQKQLEKVLKDNGISQIEVGRGDEFDPQIHEAIENKTKNYTKKEEKDIQKNKLEKEKIKEVLSNGYKMKERVIRPARVIVE